MNTDILLCIFGMCLATLVPRVVPVPLLARWLSFVPVSVLAALVMPDLVLVGGNLELSSDNLFFIASFPTLTVCWYKKGSLFSALAVGMGTIALIRYWMG